MILSNELGIIFSWNGIEMAYFLLLACLDAWSFGWCDILGSLK